MNIADKSNFIDIKVIIDAKTNKAVLISNTSNWVDGTGLPKANVKIDDEGRVVTITWLEIKRIL